MRMATKLETVAIELLQGVVGGARKKAPAFDLQALRGPQAFDPGVMDQSNSVRTFNNGNYIVYPHGYANPNYYGEYRSFDRNGKLVEESKGRPFPK